MFLPHRLPEAARPSSRHFPGQRSCWLIYYAPGHGRRSAGGDGGGVDARFTAMTASCSPRASLATSARSRGLKMDRRRLPHLSRHQALERAGPETTGRRGERTAGTAACASFCMPMVGTAITQEHNLFLAFLPKFLDTRGDRPADGELRGDFCSRTLNASN